VRSEKNNGYMARSRLADDPRASEEPGTVSALGYGDALAPAGLLLLQIAFFWRAATLRRFFAHSDICYFFEPAKAFMHESLRAGRLPLWSPYIFCGYPIAAEGQIATFYPPSLFISWLLPSPAAVNWLLISHLMLAGIAMYFLGRAIGLTPFAAWLSALVFSFSGYLFAHLHHVALVCAAAWLPAVLLAVERSWQRRSTVLAVLAAAAWAASALCGHPQTVFHISMAVIFWVGWRMLVSRRERERGYWRRAAMLISAVLVLGAGLASVQLLLTAELSALAPHGESGSLEYVTSFSLLPTHLVGLVRPNWQGTPAFNTYSGERYYWEYVLYVGLLPLMLAVVGCSDRRGRVWAGVGLVALALALAKGNPLYMVLRFVPGFSEFRAPARYIFLFTFAIAILVGYGWQVVARSRPLSSPGRRRAVAVAVALLVAADLFWFDRTLAPVAAPEVYSATPRVVQMLKQDAPWGRTFIAPPITIYADWAPPGGWAGNPDGWLEARVYLPASVPQSYQLLSIGGYAGFVDPRHALFFEAASLEAAQADTLDLYSLVGARHFVVGPSVPMPDLPSVEAPPFVVYLNRAAFPRAFVAEAAVGAIDASDALRQTFALAHEGRLREVAVAHGLPEGWTGRASSAEVVEVEEIRPERIIVRARADADALVVLNERWDPGWSARVDGEPALLLEVDSVLMGTPMPSGEHAVEFSYRPRGLVVGRAISLASLAACVLIMLGASFRARGAANPS
jgi:hypothetical protein